LTAYLDKTDAYFSAVDAVLAGELEHSKALASSRDAGNAAAAS
jgi:hypothetical protein